MVRFGQMEAIMPKKKSPNKLLSSDIVTFSDDPLLGSMVLETDEGVIDMAINRLGAEMLYRRLADFLAHKPRLG
jgi:hypothetical protein